MADDRPNRRNNALREVELSRRGRSADVKRLAGIAARQRARLLRRTERRAQSMDISASRRDHRAFVALIDIGVGLEPRDQVLFLVNGIAGVPIRKLAGLT